VSDGHRLALGHVIKLTAFDKLHAEVAGAGALTHLVDGNDARMFEAGCGFRFPTKALQMRLSGPRTQPNYFERDSAIEAFLVGAIHYALTASSDFLQQLVVTKVTENFC